MSIINIQHYKNYYHTSRNDLENAYDIFKQQVFPICFSCDECKISNDCHYLNVIRFIKHIQEKHTEKE